MGLVQAGSEWIEPLLLRNPPPTVERRRRRGSRASRSLAEPFELRSSTLGSLGNVRLAEPGLDLEAPPHNHLTCAGGTTRKRERSENKITPESGRSPILRSRWWPDGAPFPQDPIRSTQRRTEELHLGGMS
ncbi:hypothetical protein CIHG_09739 [Coccidioides immitis H538.4]|uniref:Uncharacterized protein n=1 Tax=Coccidioides immitis H538.4 TaxID=396776 RepID=A0A0J8S405_COCIT|nr:hypothetical protein CIHG_09739 [Coccidioides immitis H538.4]